MNRSYTKIRKIQEANINLEKRIVIREQEIPNNEDYIKLDNKKLFTELFTKGFNKINGTYNGIWQTQKDVIILTSSDGKKYSFSTLGSVRPRTDVNVILTLILGPSYWEVYQDEINNQSNIKGFKSIVDKYKTLMYQVKDNTGNVVYNIKPSNTSDNSHTNYTYSSDGKKLDADQVRNVYMTQLKPMLM